MCVMPPENKQELLCLSDGLEHCQNLCSELIAMVTSTCTACCADNRPSPICINLHIFTLIFGGTAFKRQYIFTYLLINGGSSVEPVTFTSCDDD